MAKLLTVANAKTSKGESLGYLTGILYLAPSDESGVMNVCANASAGCRAACLYTAGRGRFPEIKAARIKKTHWFKNDRVGFIEQLREDIKALERKAKREGMIPAVRLNGTSDIPWENYGLMHEFSHIQFYDYTKHVKRMLPTSPAQQIPNYHLTFSRSETNAAQAELVASLGKNVAVVFATKEYPASYLGLPVVNGDETDLRFLDAKGAVVGLYAKGLAKKDKSGFVVPTVA